MNREKFLFSLYNYKYEITVISITKTPAILSTYLRARAWARDFGTEFCFIFPFYSRGNRGSNCLSYSRSPSIKPGLWAWAPKHPASLCSCGGHPGAAPRRQCGVKTTFPYLSFLTPLSFSPKLSPTHGSVLEFI